MNQQSVLQYMTGRLEEITGRPVQDYQINFRTCYRMVDRLSGQQCGKGDDGDYLYQIEDLERVYESLNETTPTGANGEGCECPNNFERAQDDEDFNISR